MPNGGISMLYELLKCGLTIKSDCDNPVYVTECGYDFEKEIMCEIDSNGLQTGLRVLVITEINEQTKVPTPAFYQFPSMAPWSGDPATELEKCDDTEIESDAVEFCDGGTGFLRWYVKDNGVPTGDFFDTMYDGTLYTASGSEVPGSCNDVCQPAVPLGVLTTW